MGNGAKFQFWEDDQTDHYPVMIKVALCEGGHYVMDDQGGHYVMDDQDGHYVMDV